MITSDVLITAVVAAMVLGVVEPSGQGMANVQPPIELAFRLGTLVVLLMTKGGVPVATVMVSWPESVALVPVRPPLKVGVPLNVGEPPNVPAIDPPVVMMDGPLDVKPLFIVTPLLKVVAALKVLVPDHVLFPAKIELADGLIPSMDQTSGPSDVAQLFVGPWAYSLSV